MHPWHDIYVDDHIIGAVFPAIIEVPMGSKNKYELDKEPGCCVSTASSTAPSTIRPITASFPAPTVTTATRSTPSSSARNPSIR